MKEGQFINAEKDCNKAENESEVFVEDFGFISKEKLLNKIKNKEYF
jgi:hypothetical protein